MPAKMPNYDNARTEYTLEDMLGLDTSHLYHIATQTGFLASFVYSPREIEMAQALIAMGED